MTAVIFGDVHGRSDSLRKLIHRAESIYGYGTAFFTMGDLIDRGPDSRGVLDLCLEYKIKGVIGNHELWLLGALAPGGLVDAGVVSPIMGGVATLASYGVQSFTRHGQAEDLRENVPLAHLEWLKTLDVACTLNLYGKTWYLVHGGVNASLVEGMSRTAGFDPKQMTDDALLDLLVRVCPLSLLWPPSAVGGSGEGMYRFKDGIQVLGHTPVRAPILGGHYAALDTGCGTCPPHKLSGLALLPDGTYETFSV